MKRLWRLAQLILALVGVLLLLITFTPMVRSGARLLTSGWTATDHGVLIVLTGPTVTYAGPPPNLVIGESTYWRAIHTIYVWRRSHFQTLLVSGAGSWETVRPLLIANGIPPAAIVVENSANSTRQNAQFSKPLLAGLSGPFVLLTSDYHTLRAGRTFLHENIPVETLPAPDLLKRSNTPVLRWQGFWMLVEEAVKIVYYRVHGWI